jgi:glycosyltransferase involved in cell wall biosynthesis
LKMYLPKPIRKPLKWIVERVEHGAARCMSGLITATPTLRARFLVAHNNVMVVNNFPILDEFISDKSIDWKTREQAVTYFGGMSEARGIREMLAAMELLPRTLGAKLELAGWFYEGALQTELLNKPEWQHVIWHGELDRNGLTCLLERVMVGLVVLHPEKAFVTSQPTKLFEYMAAGIPVVASDFPLWRGIIQEAGCGLLVDPFDARAIATAIEHLITNESEAQEMGERGRMAVTQRFSWANEEEKLLSFYSSLLEERTALEIEAVGA